MESSLFCSVEAFQTGSFKYVYFCRRYIYNAFVIFTLLVQCIKI